MAEITYIALVTNNEYELVWIDNGRRYNTRINADSYTDAEKQASDITGTAREYIMRPVLQEDVERILNDG